MLAVADGVIHRSDQENKRRQRAKVVYSYAPNNDDELKLEVDDVLDVIEQDEEGWYRGLLNGKEGVFPSNFVKLFEDDDDDLPNKEKGNEEESFMVQPKKVKGVGLGNIFESGPIQLKSSIPGAKLTSTSEMTAVVRKSTVPPKKPPPPTPAGITPKPVVKEFALVLYPYDSENNDELSLKEGELVNIINKEIEDKGWWKGELNGKIGVFPDNFVESITYEEAKRRKLVPENAGNTSPKPSPHKTDQKSTESSRLEKNPEPPKKEKPQEVLRPEKSLIPPRPEKPQEPPRPEKPQEPPRPEKPPEPPRPEKLQEPLGLEKLQEPYKPDRPQELPKLEKPQEPPRSYKPQDSSRLEKPPITELQKTEKILSNPDLEKCSESNKKIPPELPKKDVIKTDNKPSDKSERPSAPAIPIKKPQLPPPIKKPLKSPIPATVLPDKTLNSTIISSEGNQEHPEENNTERLSKDKPDSSDDFDSIESTEKLTHLTANRAKNPKRRPPSHIFLKENDKEDDNDEPVWMKELKKNQAKRVSQNIPDSKSKDTTPEEVPVIKSPIISSSIKPDVNVNDSHQLSEDGSKNDRLENIAYIELQDEVKFLKGSLESLRSEFNKKLFELMVEIDEEKKIRLGMQVELERLKKLVTS